MNKEDSDVEIKIGESDDETESVGTAESTNLGSDDDTGSVGFSKISEEGDASDISDDDDDQDEEIQGEQTHNKKGGEGDDGDEDEGDEGDEDEGEGDEHDDEDDDDDEENDLHKFDHETKQNYIAKFHPECLSFNHEETETLSRVVRDETGRIVDSLHKTLPFLTKYEKTRILGIRTKQLNEGAKPYVDVNPTIIDGYIIAQLELEHKKLPFIIRRPIPNGGSELWKLQDLEIIC